MVPLAPAAITPTLLPLFVDEHLVVLDKPAGVLAVPGRGALRELSLLGLALTRWPDAALVHRLDQATSGLMLLARGATAQRQLARAFEQRQVTKHYQALVHGAVGAEYGEIDLPLAADWPQRPRQRVDPSDGRPALTRWRVLQRDADTTRLALEPVTGRTHQLRVHLQAIGHVIVGDSLYGSPFVGTRLHLHACALQLAHPGDGRALSFSSEVPF